MLIGLVDGEGLETTGSDSQKSNPFLLKVLAGYGQEKFGLQ